MRWLAVAVVLLAAVALGAVQVASSAAFGDVAARRSLPSLLHAAAPSLLRPAIGGPFARAQAAVHNGDADALRLVDALPPSAEALSLRGQLAENTGDDDAALDAYIRAGDFVRAQFLIDMLGEPQLPQAVAAEKRLLANVSGNPSASEDTGQVWWRLGQLQAALGYTRPAERKKHWNEALVSYQHALAYAPNEETYVLAAAYQSLANGDTASALQGYQRAVQIVPNSADAYGGLALTYAVMGDCGAARESAARSASLQHDAPARALTADPNVGAALRRCLSAR